jgi:hypothetical protein
MNKFLDSDWFEFGILLSVGGLIGFGIGRPNKPPCVESAEIYTVTPPITNPFEEICLPGAQVSTKTLEFDGGQVYAIECHCKETK